MRDMPILADVRHALRLLATFPVRGGAAIQVRVFLRKDGVLNPPPTSNRWKAEQEQGTAD
jgi:hypothetical protein